MKAASCSSHLQLLRSYVFAQSPCLVKFKSPDEQKEQSTIIFGWLDKVQGAEHAYKKKNGRYRDLAALRKANLLRSMVFESRSSPGISGKATANFVLKNMFIQVAL